MLGEGGDAMDSVDERRIVVATEEGIHVLTGAHVARVDDVAGRPVAGLAFDEHGWWAIVGERELWQSSDGSRWSVAATLPRRKATCLAATPAGLLVGTARAHLMRLERRALVPVPAF